MTYLDDVATDIRDAVAAHALPDEDTTGLFLSYAVLLLAKGEDVTREDVHNAWVAWMSSKGHGDESHESHESHESMLPFSELPPETQAEDSPFVIAIRTVARARGDAGRT